MVNQLKVPQPLAGARVQREDRIPEQVVAFAIRAIKVVSSGTQRDVSDAALLIERHLIPVVNAANRLPSVRRPGVVSKFTGARDHMERPHELSGDNMVGMNVGGRRIVSGVAGRQRCNDQVFEDAAGIAGLKRTTRISVESVS